MKKVIVWIALAGIAVSCEQGMTGKTASVDNSIDSVSYAIGVLTAGNLRDQEMTDLNPDLIAQGIIDMLNEKDLVLDEDACRAEVQSYMQKKQQEAMAERQKLGEDNLAKGQDFLAANKEKEGIMTTESGLQYEVLEEGSGASPAETDQVKVHYHGTLIDGTVFDSSVERGEPVTFPLNRVIPGWTEGLQLMKEGGKYKFFIPAELAYGAQGSGGRIGPNETLIFEVELLEVVPQS